MTTINGQITSMQGSITNMQGQMANAVMYDSTAHNSVTLGGVGTSTPVALHNVANGTLSANSTDAVNGSQLNATNANVTSVTNTVNNINNGSGIKYFHTNSTAADSSATGGNATAIGPVATASGSSAIATYGGESALALGANWYVSDRVLLNAHVSKSTGGGSTGASVGATIGF